MADKLSKAFNNPEFWQRWQEYTGSAEARQKVQQNEHRMNWADDGTLSLQTEDGAVTMTTSRSSGQLVYASPISRGGFHDRDPHKIKQRLIEDSILYDFMKANLTEQGLRETLDEARANMEPTYQRMVKEARNML